MGSCAAPRGGTFIIIKLAASDQKNHIYSQMIDRLLRRYAEQECPTNRFDDISAMPGKVKAKAMSRLRHADYTK